MAHNITESEIIGRVQSGDRDAFNLLVRQCGEQIYGLSFRLTGNPADAEDLAQEAFINAYKNILKFRHECSFSSWVYRITANLWKNKVKYGKRRYFFKHVSLDDPVETEDGQMQKELPDPASDPQVDLEKSQKSEAVQKVLNELDEHDRIMIVMRDVDGKSYEEISALLECPLGTVKSRLARARESLRQKYLMLQK